MLRYSTTNAKKRWISHQLELAAIAMTLKKYETLLLHLELNIFTDNAVVLNFHKFKPLNFHKFKPINNREKLLIAYYSNLN